jgi:hypothetical protein
MKFTTPIVLFCLSWGIACTSNIDQPSQKVLPKIDSISSLTPTKSQSSISDVVSPSSAIQPSPTFIAFTQEIELLNWVDDTNRLNKQHFYPQLKRKSVLFFEGQAFYPIQFEESKIYNYYHHGDINRKTTLLDIDLFRKATHIWGYFYRRTPVESWNSDGIIEQWEFPDSILAQKALEILKNRQVSNMLYFNIQPYFARFENSLYIFHSRASAFSYDQEAVFDKFIATIPKE